MLLTIDDIKPGDVCTEVVDFTPEKTAAFLQLTRDTAGIHTVESFSREKGFDNLVVHGFLLSLQFSRILGMELPGENTVIGSIQLEFHEPVYVGDRVTFTATVRRIIKPMGVVALDLDVRKSDGTVCVQGKTTCAFKSGPAE